MCNASTALARLCKFLCFVRASRSPLGVSFGRHIITVPPEAHIVDRVVGIDHRSLAATHNEVNVASAGASDSRVRVLLLKYRELAAE